MNIDEQIIKDIRKEFNLDINDMILFLLVSQIKQSILKAIMEKGKEHKTEKYKELWTLDYHCRWCGIEKGKEHLGACDFLIEANKNATINKFESVIKEVLTK